MVAKAREERAEKREEGAPGAAALWLRPLGAGLLYAVLTTLAFPGFGLWPLALVAPAPLIWAGWRAGELPRPERARGALPRLRRVWRRPAVAAWLGSAAGILPLWLYQEQWTAEVSRLGYVPMCITLALLVGLAPAMLAVAARRATDHAGARADQSRRSALPCDWVARRRGRCSHRGRPGTEAPTAPSREGRRGPDGRCGEMDGRRRVVGGTLHIAWLGPLMWAAAEVFRGEVFFTGYPWLLAAHPLIEAPGIPHLASVIGVYGVSALALLPICLAMAPGGPLIRIAGAVGALGLIVAAGFAARALALPPAERSVRIAVVQTNIPQDNKIGWAIEDRVRDMQRFLQLTERAAAAEPVPGLIVWPETMFPGFTLEPRSLQVARAAVLGQDTDLPGSPRIEAVWFADVLLEAQRRHGIPMLVGALARDGLRIDPIEFDAEYNSAFIIAHGQIAPQRYDKVHLTPFGEVMPYISNFPALEQALMDLAAGGMSFGLSRGAGLHGLTVPTGGEPLHIATPICFEAASGPTTRRLAATPRAHLLVNLTNDGWFGDFDPGRLQAAQIARWRAVELATPMVRAANTGLSGAWDSRGRPVPGVWAPEGPHLRTEGLLVVDVAIGAAAPTLFARAGWIAQWLLLAGGAAAVAWALAGGRRSTNSPATADETMARREE